MQAKAFFTLEWRRTVEVVVMFENDSSGWVLKRIFAVSAPQRPSQSLNSQYSHRPGPFNGYCLIVRCQNPGTGAASPPPHLSYSGRVQLSRERIIHAAVEILDAYGLADMTMRRLAKHLGVAPGALYWHFPNKQALIAAVAEHIIQPALQLTPPPAAEEAASSFPWQQRTTHRAVAVARQLTSVTDAAETVTAALVEGDLADKLRQFLGADIPGDGTTAAIGAEVLMHYVLSSCVVQQSLTRRAQVGAALPAAATPLVPILSGVELIIRGLAH